MFANPLGLIALAALPAVIALHLYRRRFQPRTVSALFLWGPIDATPVSGRTREMLIKSPSFWLELLAALALALAIAGPRFGRAELTVPHVVAVLDGSASMLAPGASPTGTARSTSAAQLARELLARRLSDAGGRARATVILSGPRAELLAGPSAPGGLAAKALQAPPTAHAAHDLRPALELAARFAGEDGQVLLFTDRTDAVPSDPLIERIALGRGLGNTGILRSTRTPQPDGKELLAVVVGRFADTPARLDFEVRAADAPDGPPLATRQLELEGEGRIALQFELPRTDLSLELRLTPDEFTADDTAVVAPPDGAPLRAWFALDENLARALGDSSEDSGKLRQALGGAALAASPASVEFALTDGSSATSAPQSLVLDVPAADADTRSFVGPYLIERAHPLMEGLTLDGVVWTAATAFPLTGTPLVFAGDLPLVVLIKSRGRSELRLNLDPAKSTVTRSPDWPILLANLGEAARARRPGPTARHLPQGQGLRVNGVRGERVALRGPEFEQIVEAAAAEIDFENFDRPGMYELQVGDAQPIPISVALEDARQSDLRTRSFGLEPAAAAMAAVASDTHPFDLALAALGLLCLLLDWLVLGRPAGRSASQRTAARAAPLERGIA